ncbi:hypothetical protein FBD94_16865 [Pedobacter hiemivivus]|uniref:Uncharacterized protein n=1 Tax=Pedobacter hiemivivus TaxID=2530454 RepID=A0A4U1G961_9SPHI|nr:hypothetical protein [Pedobacter hiemivivus]TKC59203.1 hypothetical protein FBD94_16865 [Pedobacter hiemivivus]
MTWVLKIRQTLPKANNDPSSIFQDTAAAVLSNYNVRPALPSTNKVSPPKDLGIYIPDGHISKTCPGWALHFFIQLKSNIDEESAEVIFTFIDLTTRSTADEF